MDYASAEWKDCVAWASREAEMLEIELSLHNSPGYSACGGPWIAPEESMKQPVWIVESASSEGVLNVRFSCFEKRREAA
jgi:hypothetical protein